MKKNKEKMSDWMRRVGKSNNTSSIRDFVLIPRCAYEQMFHIAHPMQRGEEDDTIFNGSDCWCDSYSYLGVGGRGEA